MLFESVPSYFNLLDHFLVYEVKVLTMYVKPALVAVGDIAQSTFLVVIPNSE